MVRWIGESGQPYDFELHPIGQEFAEIPAVYVFAKSIKSSKRPGEYVWGAIYFGETGDLSDRFDSHHKMPCIRRNGATHIGIYTVSVYSEDERRAIEGDILTANPTPCNDQERDRSDY